MARKLARKKPDTLYYEAVEERVLFSADMAPGLNLDAFDRPMMVDDAASGTSSAEQSGFAEPILHASADAQRELAIVNPNVDDYEQLIADLQAGDRNRTIDVAVLDLDRDGIEQVTELLSGRSDLSAVHFITHGSDGQINLGNSWLNNSTLQQYTDQIADWGKALTDTGDILFYGCNVAAHGEGQSLVDSIARLTGADVAASDDLTGNAIQGGDWILEYGSGTIETGSVVTESTQQTWNHSLSTVVVDTAADTQDGDTSSIASLMANNGADGFISLREAIIAANNTSGEDTIEFNIDTGWQVISLTSALDPITDQVTIDGWTQPGYAGTPLIILDGNQPLASNGIELDSTADGSTIRGLVLRNFSANAIQINPGSNNNTIVGNYIGSFDSAGLDLGSGESNTGSGIYVQGAGNTIGGSASTEGNVIGGNATGIVIDGNTASGNLVLGNYIGTDASGNTATANSGNGITIQNGAAANTIGGSTSAEGNIIAGNTQSGIQIDGENSDNNEIENNRIGLGADGLTALGNGYDGIFISSGPDDTIIGGANMGNVVASSGLVGIEIDGASTGTVIQGNIVGTDDTGTQNWGSGQDAIALQNGAAGSLIGGTEAGEGNVCAFSGQSSSYNDGIAILDTGTGNAILGNSIFSNQGLGIDLNDNGISSNDSGDVDSGPNSLQNFPVLDSANLVSSTQLQITGSFNSTADSYFRIEFFANATGDSTGYGEGQRFLGYVNVNTDTFGDATISTTLSAAVTSGETISATATQCDASFTVFTNTSEFSNNATTTNTAPSLDNAQSPALTSIDEDAGAPSGAAGTLVSELVDFAFPAGQIDNVTDPDSGALLGIAVTASDTTNGSWWYSTDNGSSWNTLDTVSESSARLLAADSGTRIYFQPDADYNGNMLNAITFRAWDQTSGANGDLADASTTGGSTAFSSSTDTISLTVNAVNDAPTITSDGAGATASINAAENQTAVTTVTATDADGDTPTFSITGGADQALFGIDTNTGVLTFNTAPDYENPTDSNTDGIYQVQVTADDGNGGTDSQLISVTVTDTNDAPVTVADSFTVNEGSTTTLDLAANDSDADDGLDLTSIAIVSGPSNGSIVVNSNGTVDYTHDGSETTIDSFTYTIDDLAGQTSNTAMVNLTITPVNDAPAGADNTISINEDTVYTFSASDFGFSDVDGNNLSRVWITTLPSQGQLMWNGSTFAANNWIAIVDIDAGLFTYAPVANASGTGYTSFTFQVEDDGGIANGGISKDPSPNIITIDVTPVNDAPVGSPTITGTAAENQTLSADTSSITDADGLGSFSYQWLRDGVAIAGATASTYTAGNADVGRQISVQVSYTDGHGTYESLVSPPSAPVASADDGLSGQDDTGGLLDQDTWIDDSGTGETTNSAPGTPTDGTLPEYPQPEITTTQLDEQHPARDDSDHSDNSFALPQGLSADDLQQLAASAEKTGTNSAHKDRNDSGDYASFDVDLYQELYYSKHIKFKSVHGKPNAKSPMAFSGIDLDSLNAERLDIPADYDLFRQQLDDAFRAQAKSQSFKTKLLSITSASITAGVVSYLLRTNTLVASLLSSLPAWRRFDPIAVFSGKKKKRNEPNTGPGKDESESESFFDDGENNV